MTALATRVVHQRGVVVALITGASVFAVLIVQALLTSLFGYLSLLMSGLAAQSTPWTVAELGPIALTNLPFAIGVFLALWFVAPIASDLRLFHVITRGLLAAAIGGALAIVVAVVGALFGAFSYSAGFSSNLAANLGYDFVGAFHRIGFALNSGLSLFVSAVPLVVLACVLLWIWLERHPRNHQVAGIVDEV
ncbi:MAG: hypothetical protein JWN36_170 [Microbacteriaceae bacterium]|nr:hypothetical protein [Microbacteriaceae bacterium]